MSDSIQWLTINPVDTLFFRGAEPMIAGESHEVNTVFPPMPATIIGAIRGEIMAQQGKSPRQYMKDAEKTAEECPLFGLPDKPGFELAGPIFSVVVDNDETLLLPVPSHWFAEYDSGENSSLNIHCALPLSDEIAGFGITGSATTPLWCIKPESAQLKSLSGCWMTVNCLQQAGKQRFKVDWRINLNDLTRGQAVIIPESVLFHREFRVGIALDRNRNVKDGHLYSASHVRLHLAVAIVAGIIAEVNGELAPQGIMQLGGEQRMCSYSFREPPALSVHHDGPFVMNLSPTEAVDNDFVKPIYAAKLLRVGGWDMKRGFHKKMTTYYPSGSVFQPLTRKIPAGYIAC